VIEAELNILVKQRQRSHTERGFRLARYRETQMKTSQFSENFDLCHPAVGSSEHSNNILATDSNFTSDTASKLGSLGSTAVNYSTPSTSTATVATYGSSSSDHQPSKFEKNANELLIKNHQNQQQEQNKKRKRETGKYVKKFSKRYVRYKLSSMRFISSLTLVKKLQNEDVVTSFPETKVACAKPFAKSSIS
jgi:hypothetical protein